MSKETKRVSDAIRCIDCKFLNAYERRVDGVWDIFCPDCGAVFGWDNLPKECLGCKGRLSRPTEVGRGLCPACYLKTYSPEKRAALNKLIGLAFKPGGATDAEKEAAVDEAFKHLD
jgi:hypothetical protein